MDPSRRRFLASAALTTAALAAACSRAVPSQTASPTADPTPTTSPTSRPPPSSSPQPTTEAATPAKVAGGPARFVANGPRDGNRVALTFHASGDPGQATRLLDLLATAATSVTVFAVGTWLEANPSLAERIVTDGHELANHTYTHPPLGRRGAAEVADEITRCGAVVAARTGAIGAWFRPSGIREPTATILVEAGRAGYPVSVGYDVDSLDYQDPGADAVRANTAVGLAPGAIISLHFGHEDTITALPGILDDLAAAGLEPVTVGTLLA